MNREGQSMDTHKGVLVCGEIADGKLAPITIELLGIGKKLASELGEDLSVLLMGSKAGGLGQEAIAYGADKVYVAEDGLLDQYNSDAYTQVAADLCRKVLPSIMLFGHTDVGCDLAPRLNGRLGGGLSMDCLALSIDPATKLLVSTRPVFGGNAQATTVSKSARPQMATLRLKTVPAAERNDSRQGQVIPVEGKVDPSALKVQVIERIKEQVEGVKLEDAEVVVAGGRGIGSAKNWEMVQELARVLGGAVGATRPACDEGWASVSLQVGQSGKVVSPKLYIGIALSGAMSHISGCLGSKVIVAINKDKEANIFNVAHFGIVGDYKEVVPALTAKLKELKPK
ncbi:MAG: electron transfer flavoprotein subunit alpha/FixB family protein [Deltaproteobacteria bacterium]|nr:electron transfer flavoprotein subunit alpha/FixB family protein [Deltaproteobacteria bacterium]MBM4323670.1 electron transfer flavoprotein subunit alpha/FixB family protein [Deltaproteobacteria bacterium]